MYGAGASRAIRRTADGRLPWALARRIGRALPPTFEIGRMARGCRTLRGSLGAEPGQAMSRVLASSAPMAWRSARGDTGL